MFNFPTKTDKFLTVERIYQKTTEAEIFRHFLGFDFKVGELYKSPLRQDDKNPSFNIYVNSQGHLRYKDWGHSQGTCIDFVSHLYNVDFYTACLTINSSMNLGFIGSKGQKVEYSHYKSLAINPSEKEVRCRLRQWRTHDIYYWKYKYYISSSTLSFFDIHPGKEVWVRKTGENWKKAWVDTTSNPIYIYKIAEYFLEDNILTFGEKKIKCYRPYQIEALERNSKFKWLTGMKGNYVQGLEQLPSDGNILFITSSLKDICVLHEIGIPAIAPNAESSFLDENLIEHLKTRFKRIYVNYDSDDPGVRASISFTEKYNLEYWNIPKEYECKDVSDYINRYGQENLINLINEKIPI